MIHRLAFAGFRHPHIFGLWERAKAHSQCEIVAAWENDPGMRKEIHSAGKVHLTHDTFDQMLGESGCTIAAIGDVYARRGSLIIAALKAGKHVISDKPICTTLEEFDQIAHLTRENGLSVGCQLDLVESGVMRQLKRVISEGMIGTVCTLTNAAQHPLRFGSRAAWYFQPGLHGGTINDIGVHIFDLVPWLTGSRWKTLLAAREWNAKASGAKHFKDCAQFLAVLENGSSCFADLSYLAPDKIGYELPQYWRVTVHGTKGMAEASYNRPSITVVTDDDTAPQELLAICEAPRGYLQDFFDEITGTAPLDGVTTDRVLYAAHEALKAQAAAKENIP